MRVIDQRPLSGAIGVFRALNEQCAQVVASSLQSENEALIGDSYVFASDLEAWREAISEHSEANLLATAAAEYVISMLNVCQGQYRNGFKGLRLVLELCIQGVYLSANLETQRGRPWSTQRLDH
jgi:hypothetical protein